MSNLNRPVVNFKQSYYQRSGSKIVVTPPAIPIVDRYLNKITIGVKLPPDIQKLLDISAQQRDIVGCLNALMNGLEVHVDRTNGNLTLLADLRLALAILMQWKVAIAWCLRDYLKTIAVNESPYNRKDYRALQSHGEYVYAKFELIEVFFKAFELMNIPNPWNQNFLDSFVMAMFEEINRAVQTQYTSKDQATKVTRKMIADFRRGINPYLDSADWRVNHDLFAAIQIIIVSQPTDNNAVKKARSAVKRKYTAFIGALQRWTKDVESDPQNAFTHAVVDEKTGQIYATQKRKKGTPGRKRMTDIPTDKQKQ
ncbi:hypothetical protein [Leptolyngbya sp. NIES-2104]|uniref:hypothetical protein n=1 Tax=Leptolyngbya sp. NIES-2104 TaxID=1552121 RepID=UPI0006EC8E34|nr:hypothetical protein [Leptolyngbya sp. NIES-2104]GAP96113.1 hypothetical protein NIES2104_26480 [Leptolyngbya sp. NIES-2104]